MMIRNEHMNSDANLQGPGVRTDTEAMQAECSTTRVRVFLDARWSWQVGRDRSEEEEN